MYLTQDQLEQIGFKALGKNVKLSTLCSIYNPGNISIGDNTRIDDFTLLSAGTGGIEIGRYVHLACYASIVGKGKVTLDDFSALSFKVSLFSSNDSYDGEYMTNPTLPSSVTNTQHADIHIGKHVVVGSHSIVVPGVNLPDGCAVGAMSMVRGQWANNMILVGIPAKVLKIRLHNIYDLEKKINLESVD